MTKNNEEIIIDDVDVSGCRFYSEKLSTMNGTGSISVTKCNGFCTHNIRGLDDSSCYDIHTEYAKCENNNCYYKQLKRKEQECEELKVENNTYKSSIIANLDNSISKRYRELLEENDQLKETIEGLLSIQYKLADNNKQLRQTLAEIKPILEYYANSTIGYKTKEGIYRIELSYKYGYSNSCGEPCYYEYNPKPAKEALRKINEVENEN